jgi:protein involved in polysaccharide export with SLBB domain
MMRAGWRGWLLAALPLTVAACAATPSARLPPADHTPAAYLIKVGDTLDIRFYKTPELNLEVPVRSDGKVSLELIGDVQAAGLEPEQLAGSLRERYASELTEPQVSVIVRKFGGGVWIGGEVKSPSRVPFSVGMTALQAIHRAGGFLDTARTSSVVLIRLEGSHYKGYVLPLDQVQTGKDLSVDAELQPSDIVHVPKSGIANVDLFVDQYVRKVLPVQPAIPIF